jgi:hypothetical protein
MTPSGLVGLVLEFFLIVAEAISWSGHVRVGEIGVEWVRSIQGQ